MSLTRSQVLRGLSNQTISIPDLTPIFEQWKAKTNELISPHVEELRVKVTQRLHRLYSEGRQLKKLESADFALFTAYWWPKAALKNLETLAFLVIWLFTWDDEIDEPTGFCSDDFQAAQKYRKSTLEFVGLSLCSSGGRDDIRPRNAIIQSFDVIGADLRRLYSPSQCHRFYREIARFMHASETEQRLKLEDDVPTLEQYWPIRLGTSAVYIGIAAAEYSIPTRLSDDITNNCYMQDIWDETNVIISITNDLLSLRKELRQGCIDSIVPLTFARCMDANGAVAQSVWALRAAKERFDEAAEELQVAGSADKEIGLQVAQFIEVCKSNCVGNLKWSLITTRYDMSDALEEDGSATFVGGT